jgi:hypothetical protein
MSSKTGTVGRALAAELADVSYTAASA